MNLATKKWIFLKISSIIYIIKKKNKMRLLTALFFALGLASCSFDGVGVEGLNQEVAKPQEVLNFGKLPLKNHLGQLTAVIEIPAGTSHKYE